MRARVKAVGLLTGLVLLTSQVLLGSMGALAPASASGTVRAADEADPDAGRLMLVLDSSGSMAEPSGGGTTKIAAAKQALGVAIDALGESQQVGLRVYGSKVFSAKDPGACTDSELVVEPGVDNRDELAAAVESYKPYGETPIGHALREAGKDLGNEGARTIILVSDGVPTCDPDPCVVAEELSRTGIDLRIDVVGLDVDAKARAALECIAANGNGTYYDARDAEELTKSLSRLAERSARGYQTVGQPVRGTADPAQAPVITAGDWVDTYERGQDFYQYRIQRTIPGSSLVASATVRGRGDVGVMVRSKLATDEAYTCDAAVGLTSFGRLAATSVTASEFDRDETCRTADELVFEVEVYRWSEARKGAAEIRVLEIPPVVDPESLASDPASDPVWAEPAADVTTPVSGGTSFADPEPLDPGSYAGEIVPGEILTFAVDADWGQQVDVRAQTEAVSRSVLKAGLDTASLGVQVFGPGRSELPTSFMEGTDLDSEARVTGPDVAIAATSGAVYFDKLASGSDAPFYAGTHIVVLTLGPGPLTQGNLPKLPVPYRLDLAVTGDVLSTPQFTSGEQEETAEPSPSASPTQETEEPGSATPSDDDSRGGIDGPMVAMLAGALVAVALLATLIGLAVRRRSAGKTP